jgi:hypothetical protein
VFSSNKTDFTLDNPRKKPCPNLFVASANKIVDNAARTWITACIHPSLQDGTFLLKDA